jgi:hypothetical protein
MVSWVTIFIGTLHKTYGTRQQVKGKDTGRRGEPDSYRTADVSSFLKEEENIVAPALWAHL